MRDGGLINQTDPVNINVPDTPFAMHIFRDETDGIFKAKDSNNNLIPLSFGISNNYGAFTDSSGADQNQIAPTIPLGNVNDSNQSSILGGKDNTIDENSSFSAILSGANNLIENSINSSILGGGSDLDPLLRNRITLTNYSAIVSGQDNSLTGSSHSFIGAGTGNRVQDLNGGIVCGLDNFIGLNNNESFIGGGYSNYIYDSRRSVIVGGDDNSISGTNQYNNFIGGGGSNFIADSNNSSITGGFNNRVDNGHNNSHIIGSNITSTKPDQLHIENLALFAGHAGTLRAFDDDASAGAAGLVSGEVFQTTGAGPAPLNMAGILMIKQ